MRALDNGCLPMGVMHPLTKGVNLGGANIPGSLFQREGDVWAIWCDVLEPGRDSPIQSGSGGIKLLLKLVASNVTSL